MALGIAYASHRVRPARLRDRARAGSTKAGICLLRLPCSAMVDRIEAFHALTPDERNEMTARILLPERGISNITCPVTMRPVRMDSPVVRVDGRWIALRNVEAARTFNSMSFEDRRAIASPIDW